MKKSAFVAIVVMALVFGLVAYATAQDETVTVTATVNPVFSMTLDSHTFSFGAMDIGDDDSIQGPVITIKSNKTYTYSSHAATVDSVLNDAVSEAAILARESESESVTQGTKGARGVSRIEYDYRLNLSDDGSYDIGPSDYTFTHMYTATQN